MKKALNDCIVLVYPYFKTEDNINQKLFNPLGIAFLSAQLKLKGINVVKIDCTFKSFYEVIQEILRLRPKIIGFYTMITFTKNIFKLMDELKPNLPNSLFICGGPLATLYPSKFSKVFDVIFKGEMDIYFPKFVKSYFNCNQDKMDFLENEDFSNNSGIYINKESFFYENDVTYLSEKELRLLPLPDRSRFDHKKYQQFWFEKEGIKATSIITTFGCPFLCDFCSKPIFGNYFRKREISEIIKEIESIKALEYNYLWISDDCFTLDLKFLEDFCDSLIEKKIKIKYSCLSRADNLNIKLLKKMKKSGCEKVYMGLESGNNTILKLMKKNLTIEQGRRAVNLLKEANIEIAGFFIVGYPGETWETIEQTFNYALELDLNEVSFNVPYPLPDSELFKRVLKTDFERDWTYENETSFVFESEFNEDLVKEKIREFYEKHEKIKDQTIFTL